MAQFEDCLKDLSVSAVMSVTSMVKCVLSSDECDLNNGTQQLTQSQALYKENIITQKSLYLLEISEEWFFFYRQIL